MNSTTRRSGSLIKDIGTAVVIVSAAAWWEQYCARKRWHARDEVDVAVEDSFPASDPPSWTAGKAQ